MRFLLRYVGDIIRQLPDPFCRLPGEWRQACLRRDVRDRIKAGNSGWAPDPKVFGIGLSKTGTSSLSRALELLGYNSLHWKKRKKVIGWPEFFWADAATDISVSARFEALYHTFENSKFIYTTRDVDSWSTSVARHYGMESPRGLRYTGDRRLNTEGRRLIQQDPEWGFHNTIHEVQAHESLYAQHDTWKEAYRAHDNRIRTFFDDKPDDQFLEMSITGGDKWEPLCAFLGHEVVDRSFPHVDPSE